MRVSSRSRPSSRSSASAFCASLFAARRVVVDLEEHAVDARRHAGRRQRVDELRLAGRDAVAGARQLQAVRHVEDDRVAEAAHDRERAHVDHEVVVAERGAALGEDDALRCRST